MSWCKFKRIEFMDFIHRPVSQDKKKLKIVEKRLKLEQIKTQTSTNKSHKGPITNHRATYLGTHTNKHLKPEKHRWQ
jgi:hypothetical protein